MHGDESNTPIPITEAALERMPRPMSKRLRAGLRPEIEAEFLECIDDFGYKEQLASPMLRQILFELFIGGWGAKIRQLKRRKTERES